MSGFEYGTELPDQVDKISRVTDAQLDLLRDIRDLLRERVTLEKEYSAKLQALAKKAGEKKSKIISRFVLGDEPSRPWTEETVKKSTFENAYSEFLSSMGNGAQSHMVLADSLASQVIEELKKLEQNGEETKKKQSQFFEKLVADRDRVYNERSKAKQKYDEECMEVESYRHKQDRAGDDKHAGRAAKQLEQQKIDMLNAKNTYLIAISVANKAKSRFYEQDLPLLENQLQSIQAHLVTSLTTLLTNAQSLHSTHMTSLQSHSAAVNSALSQVNTQKDHNLFVEYNRDPRPFKIPENWKFEPCEGFYDTSDMSVETSLKVILQNKLGRCRMKLGELRPVIESKKREIEKYEGMIKAHTQDKPPSDLDETRENHLEAQHQLTSFLTSCSALEVEVETISAVLGDDEGAQRLHSFKSSSFSIPTQCAYCKTSIWGLSKQGKTCKLCHLSVHSRCELKVPSECTGGNSLVHRTTSISSASIMSSPSEERFISSPTRVNDITAHEGSRLRGTVIFPFKASSPFEISVSSDEQVHLLEEDDGSGWIKIAGSNGAKGLVPASYVEFTESGMGVASSATTNITSPRNGKFVRAIFSYEAQSDDELSLREGETVELSTGPQGGQNYAEGWWEGFDKLGRKGIFPSNYVELA